MTDTKNISLHLTVKTGADADAESVAWELIDLKPATEELK